MTHARFTSYRGGQEYYRLYHATAWGWGILTSITLAASNRWGLNNSEICWVQDNADDIVNIWIIGLYFAPMFVDRVFLGAPGNRIGAPPLP